LKTPHFFEWFELELELFNLGSFEKSYVQVDLLFVDVLQVLARLFDSLI
jgi:hypothetical protein